MAAASVFGGVYNPKDTLELGLQTLPTTLLALSLWPGQTLLEHILQTFLMKMSNIPTKLERRVYLHQCLANSSFATGNIYVKKIQMYTNIRA